VLSARDAYRIWAPSYEQETAVSFIEDALVSQMTPPLAGRRLLDVGCGTGRRLRTSGASVAVGIDCCPEMIAAGAMANAGVRGLSTLVGDVRRLPTADRAFEVIWCRLVLGHLPEIDRAYAELARVADDGGIVVVSDFHEIAHAGGHRRTFRAQGEVHEVEHYVHPLASHVEAARGAGLTLVDWREGLVGPDVRHFYAGAGRPALYREHFGLPLVLALAFERRS
jgi:malonyl-CoA O-methyltransferase